MDKVTILTASRVEPGISITPRSRAGIITALGPALQYAGHLQSILSSASTFLCLHAYFLASVIFATALYASEVVAFQAYIATKFGALHGLAMSHKIVLEAWKSKRAQAVRDKLFHEFAVFILGSGNPVILMVFWPGWFVIGGTSLALWHFWG